MVIYFRSLSFTDSVMGRMNYYANVTNGKEAVSLDRITEAIQSVKDYASSVLDDEDSEDYEEIELWGAYDYICHALEKAGYAYEIIADEMETGFTAIVPDNAVMSDIKPDATIEL